MNFTNTATFKLPSVRGKQAGDEYYSSMVKISEAVKLFQVANQDLLPEERAQRKVNTRRVNGLVKYILLNQNSYILPPIVIEVGCDFAFSSFEDSEFGYLEMPMDAPIFIADGQHRIKAFGQVITEVEVIKEELISVVIYRYKNLKKSQSRFADINRNTKVPAKSLSLLYDHDDKWSDLCRGILKKTDLYNRFVEKEKNSCSGKSSKLFSLRDIYLMVKTIEQINSKAEKSLDFTKLQGNIYIFFEILAENMLEWKKAYSGTSTAKDARDFTVATHNITLQALAIVAGRFIVQCDEADIAKETWYEYLKPLSQVDFSKANPEIETIAIRDAKVIKNKETINGLALHIQTQLLL